MCWYPQLPYYYDCSRPQHSDVNSYNDTQHHYSYVTVDTAVSRIKSNAYLAKIDLKNTNRHVPIHPSNYPATGLAWQFRGDTTLTYLYDCKLQFEAPKSPEILHRLTQAITRIMKRRGLWFWRFWLILMTSFDYSRH